MHSITSRNVKARVEASRVPILGGLDSRPRLDLEGFEQSALVKAVRDGNIDLLCDLLRRSSLDSVSAALFEAVARSQIPIIKILLHKGCTDIALQNAIAIAIKSDAHEKVVSLLLDHYSKVSVTDWLETAIACLSPKFVKYFIKMGAEVKNVKSKGYFNTQGIARSYKLSPLLQAIQMRNSEIIRIIVDAGANVNESGEYHQSPLSSAIREHCDLDVIRYLIFKGANVNQLNLDGFSPLLAAIHMKRVDVAYLLLEHKADANIMWNSKMKVDLPLTAAIAVREPQLVKHLIQLTAFELLESMGETEDVGLIPKAIIAGDICIITTLLRAKLSPVMLEAPTIISRSMSVQTLVPYVFMGPVATLLAERIHFFEDQSIPLLHQFVSNGLSLEPKKSLYVPPLVAVLMNVEKKDLTILSSLQQEVLREMMSLGANVDYTSTILPDALIAALNIENVEALRMLLPFTRYTPCDIADICIKYYEARLCDFILRQLSGDDDFTSLSSKMSVSLKTKHLVSLVRVPSLCNIARQKVRQCLPKTNTSTEFLRAVAALRIPESMRKVIRFYR